MILALALAAVVPAQASPVQPAPTFSAEEQAIALELFAASQLPREKALAAIEAVIAKLPRPTLLRNTAVCARAAMLGQLRRDSFKAAADECYRLLPTHPMALGMYSSAHAFDLDPGPAVRAYLALLRQQPRYAFELQPDQALTWLHRLNELRQDRLSAEFLAELTRAGFGAAHPRFTSQAALANIDAAVQSKRLADAKALLPNVIHVDDAKPLLIDRSFDPIAADIRSWAADGLVSQRDALITATQGLHQIDPTLERHRDYAEALLLAGQRADAINLLRAALVDKSEWDEERYQVVLTGIRLANILSAGGDHSEGALVLERLGVELAEPKYRHGAVSIAPNLARIYIRAGRHADALTLLDRSGLTAADFGNEAHRGFVAALRGCALAGLGRSAEAEEFRTELERDTGSTRSAWLMLIACLRDHKALIADTLLALDHPRSRRGTLVELRALEVTPTSTDNEYEAAMRQVLRDSTVRKRLDEFSRPVESAHIPAFHSWSSPRGARVSE